jgi:hypothetical protein
MDADEDEAEDEEEDEVVEVEMGVVGFAAVAAGLIDFDYEMIQRGVRGGSWLVYLSALSEFLEFLYRDASMTFPRSTRREQLRPRDRETLRAWELWTRLDNGDR